MSEETIFSEVDEDLRSERMHALWRRFGPWVIGAAVLVVILVGINEGWRWYQNDIAAKSSDQFYSALQLLDSDELTAANDALNKTIAEGSGAYPDLARFAQAALLVKEGKTAEAVAAYDALANTQSNGRMREIALLLAASAMVDSGDVAGVQSRIAGLISPANPLRHNAREILGLTKYAADDKDGARKEFSVAIADPQVPLDLLRRLQVYDSQLAAEGAADPAAEPVSTETAPATE